MVFSPAGDATLVAEVEREFSLMDLNDPVTRFTLYVLAACGLFPALKFGLTEVAEFWRFLKKWRKLL